MMPSCIPPARLGAVMTILPGVPGGREVGDSPTRAWKLHVSCTLFTKFFENKARMRLPPVRFEDWPDEDGNPEDAAA
jgi:hypothetical protein